MEEQVKDWGDHFQTPAHVCEYMASMVSGNNLTILEPTPGKGNLVRALEGYGKITAPDNFNNVSGEWFDWIVMNPPFTPMKEGYRILYECMAMSDNIITLMPYLTIINSKKRTNDIMDWGLKSITHLHRNVFKGSRVQTCILEMRKGYTGDTVFRQLPE